MLRHVLIALAVVLLAAALAYWRPWSSPTTSVATVAEDTLRPGLEALLADHRKIIVLLANEAGLAEADRRLANTVGQALFHDKLERQAAMTARLATLVASEDADRWTRLETALDYIESGKGLYDADRLAFRELLVALQQPVAEEGSLPAIRLHKRIGEDLEALAEIERQYDKEISQIFSRFETRAIVLKREKWDDYLAHLGRLYAREQILREYGFIQPYPMDALPAEKTEVEITGRQLPPKTLALTFDDGPHGRYTEEITAILRQYGVPAAFFAVGRNIGTVEADGSTRLARTAAISRRLMADGYAVGNHSYSHAQLSKTGGETLYAEIHHTDTLLKALDTGRAPLFRFPYGARSKEGMSLLQQAQLRSVMWNIDSLDWADPVPRSIADRVLRSVEKEGRGIVLFHDIHERTVKALPLILDRLVADGYRFAAWDGQGFSVQGEATAPASPVTSGYANSWAVVIGINEYGKWPRLRHAVHDAEAVRDVLLRRFGFAPERVITLKDGEATRQRILATFHDEFGHGRLQKNDRIFVFFAGHGATRTLSSGREIGYIVPVDADPEATATDAIPMTEIQNIAESLSAKHVFFVMDACYSGLGLTRGASRNFLRENARRLGRQMLTAGGADQVVADDGPGGHSIFTWTLLQGLEGKGDLNGDGLITAMELAAYVAPTVASVSAQTPAFGSLPGSEGGDFVFELPAATEFLSEDSTQLSTEAIALNSRLDAAAPTVTPTAPGRPAEVAAVKVPDLQGRAQTLTSLPAASPSTRQMAQHANDRGLQLYKEKRYAEAEAQFAEALKLRPDFALAANNLGFVFYRQQKYAEAVRWFENTLKLDPSRAVAYLNLGDARMQLEEKKKAAEAYRTYLTLLPNGPAAAHARTQLERL